MWKALIDMFQNNNDQRKLALKENLRKIKKEEGEMVPTYLAKFTQFRDELGSIGVTIVDDEFVRLALIGLPKAGIVIRTLSLGGRSYQIGSDFGWIWYKKNSGGILGMDPHPRKMMRKIVPWMEGKEG